MRRQNKDIFGHSKSQINYLPCSHLQEVTEECIPTKYGSKGRRRRSWHPEYGKSTKERKEGIPRMRTEVLSEQPDLMRDSQEIWEGFLKETVNQINIT